MARQAMEAARATQMTEAFKAMVIIPVLLVALALVLRAASRTILGDIDKREQMARLTIAAGA